MLSVQWRNPDPEMFFSPFPFALIAVASVIMFIPVYAVAGAVGAAVRPRLVGPRRAPVERTAGQTLERRQWIGIAVGALCIAVALGLASVAGLWAGLYLNGNALTVLFLVSAFAGGFAAGILSAGGARAGFGSGLLAGVFGLGAIALYFICAGLDETGNGRWCSRGALADRPRDHGVLGPAGRRAGRRARREFQEAVRAVRASPEPEL